MSAKISGTNDVIPYAAISAYTVAAYTPSWSGNFNNPSFVFPTTAPAGETAADIDGTYSITVSTAGNYWLVVETRDGHFRYEAAVAA